MCHITAEFDLKWLLWILGRIHGIVNLRQRTLQNFKAVTLRSCFG